MSICVYDDKYVYEYKYMHEYEYCICISMMFIDHR